MIPLFRTRRMESAANLLVKNFRHVLVRAAYDNYVRIRFRADAMIDPRCYFNKVPSQFKKWRETGGVLVSWKNIANEGPHDALVIAECPASMEIFLKLIQDTGTLAVIYEPPTWRQHEQKVERRFSDRPNKLRKHRMRLRVMRAFLEHLPEFSRHRLRSVQEESAQSSAFRARSEGAVTQLGKPNSIP